MLTKSPSGALSPYYYKGGYFHGIHYGSFFDDMDTLKALMNDEEHFIMRSPDKRRIMIDLYETNLSPAMLDEFTQHIGRMNERIVKLAISGNKRSLKEIGRAFRKLNLLGDGRLFLSPDMEEGKTWLVSDKY